jgi:drug/metabolite transporter (DMT)-like permease
VTRRLRRSTGHRHRRYHRPVPYLLFILISILWGSNFILMKWAGQVYGPITLGGWRMLLGSLMIGLFWILRGARWTLRPRHAGPVLLLVLMGYVYPFAMQPHLINKTGSSAFIGMMPSLVPLMTIIASVPLLRTHPTPRQLAGVLGGLAFMALAFYDRLDIGGMTGLDVALAILVPLMYATANTFIKRNLSDVPATDLTFAAMGLGGLLLVPFGYFLEPLRDVEPAAFERALWSMILFGTIGTGVATVMFYSLIQSHGPLFAGMVSYLIPVVALLLAVLTDEPITMRQAVALAGVLAMVALVQIRPRGKPAAAVEPADVPVG